MQKSMKRLLSVLAVLALVLTMAPAGILAVETKAEVQSNLPDGIAAGVSFGSEDVSRALLIAGGIALQNIPEGMIIIAPMLAAGVTRGRTLLIALATGLVEVVGTLIGYFAVSIAAAVLPFGLAFAGGTMLYVVSDEMIFETHSHGSQRAATYALLVGFCVMLISDVLMG
jgi:ZIP family zinc transporter